LTEAGRPTDSDDEQAATSLAHALAANGTGMLADLLAQPFRPGTLFKDTAAADIKLGVPYEAFLNIVAGAARQVFAANYTHEGFWADHWTYDLDQIESFEVVFPDDVERALWDAPPIPFYMSSGTVQARAFKYVEVEGLGVRQYNSVYDDPEKLGQLADRVAQPDGAFQLASGHGGDTNADLTYVYEVAPVAKLFLLCATKFTLLDPSGMGLEMEANKPGWNDAMNGLPGLLGSGMPETCEVWCVATWLLRTLRRIRRPIVVPAELADLVTNVTIVLDDASLDQNEYWQATAGTREDYRAAVRLFFSGVEVELSSAHLIKFLAKVQTKLEAGIAKALAYSNDGVIMPTYFQHEVVEYEHTGFRNFMGQPFVTANKFKTKVLPLFLEGPVRHLKTVPRDNAKALTAIHDAVLRSKLYDAAIGQYKICESLEGQPFEIGRMMAFTPGWLENESIWLHMSFKYYLELLRAGLFDQFWTAMETGAPYNMDIDTYGRSPLECGSFIVSSAYPDKALWGSSFLARLSGSTAEFLSIWLLIFAGPAPFTFDNDGDLRLALRPAIPSTLFKEDGTASFRFLGGVVVTYINEAKKDTWKLQVVEMKIYTSLDDKDAKATVKGPSLSSEDARNVRDLKIAAIEATLG